MQNAHARVSGGGASNDGAPPVAAGGASQQVARRDSTAAWVAHRPGIKARPLASRVYPANTAAIARYDFDRIRTDFLAANKETPFYRRPARCATGRGGGALCRRDAVAIMTGLLFDSGSDSVARGFPQ
ncbi:MAG: hypothetical protein AMXMBFR82_25520 [Candidatus Hydrogenedentota bacterium]